MSWTAKYRPRRQKQWPEIEQFFGNLPPRLFEQGALLKNNLAVAYSDSGQFSDILAGPRHFPLLYLHFWLLDDFNFPDTSTRATLEKHLFLASVFTLCSVYTQQSILNEGSSFDSSYLLLEQTLTRQAQLHLQHLFAGPSPFWQQHRDIWQQYAEAILTSPNDDASVPDLSNWPAVRQLADRLAFAKIPVAAVALSAGQEAKLPELYGLVERLNLIFQTLHDISTLRRDIVRRNYTYPILRTMQAAQINPRHPVSPERILGASVLTGAIANICQELRAYLQSCQNMARTLQLPSFVAYFPMVDNFLQEVQGLFALNAPASVSTKPFFAPATQTQANAVQIAEQFLLSDLTFREAWEVQRGGPNRPQLVAKAFPAGLVVEILCRHGHTLGEQVSQIFQMLQNSGFRYYNFSGLPPDADDLGLLLRLHGYAAPARQAAYAKILQTPLRWMEASIHPSGEIPVWFKTAAAGQDEPGILVWGNRCATTEVNLLRGLLAFDGEQYATIIKNSVRNLLRRLKAGGLGATLYYPPPYILWATLELLQQLVDTPVAAALGDDLNQAVDMLLARFEQESRRPAISPQTAAFFALTCRQHPAAQPLFNERWLAILHKSQRHDGSWPAEPLFLIPDWRGTAWYASRPVTTAFCYHALKTHLKPIMRK